MLGGPREVIIESWGSNSKETAKSRHNGGGGAASRNIGLNSKETAKSRPKIEQIQGTEVGLKLD